MKQVLGLPYWYPCLLIFDVYKAQLDQTFLDTLTKYYIFYVFIPAGLTDMLQPMDLTVNRYFKHQYKELFTQWYGLQVFRRVSRGDKGDQIVLKVPMKLIKPVSFDWIVGAYNTIDSSLVHKGFQEANISDVYYNNGQFNYYPCNPSITIQALPPQNLITLTKNKGTTTTTTQQITSIPNSNTHLPQLPPPQIPNFISPLLPSHQPEPLFALNSSSLPTSFSQFLQN